MLNIPMLKPRTLMVLTQTVSLLCPGHSVLLVYIQELFQRNVLRTRKKKKKKVESRTFFIPQSYCKLNINTETISVSKGSSAQGGCFFLPHFKVTPDLKATTSSRAEASVGSTGFLNKLSPLKTIQFVW